VSWLAFLLEYVLPVLTAGTAAPIVKRFLVAWRERRNAISLAIAGAVVACAGASLTPFLAAQTRVTFQQVAVGLTLANVAVLVGFAFARRHERLRFQDQRGRMGVTLPLPPPKEPPS
jgi:ABC-type glycerol-3-phosphate transport system permease component